MTGSESWIANLESELRSLVSAATTGTLDPADEWRLLVLLARGSQLVDTPEAITELVTTAGKHELVRRFSGRLLEAGEIAAALDSALCADDDPAGSLADALLDTDDLASVLWMLGRTREANALIDESLALVQAFSSRVAPLTTWAVRRLDVLDPEHPLVSLWAAVHSSPAAGLAAAPLSQALDADSISAILDRADRHPLRHAAVPLSSVAPVRNAYLAAAAGRAGPFEPVHGPDYAIYPERNLIVVQVRLDGRRPRPEATLVVRDENQEWRRQVPLTHAGSDSAWYELPATDELGQWFASGRAAVALPIATVPTIELDWVEQGENEP